MTFAEMLRFRDKYPVFQDSKGQNHIVIDGLDILVTPSNEEWNEHKEEIGLSLGIDTAQ